VQLISLLCAFIILPPWGAAQATTPAVAVVYPDVREPYQGIFLEIVRGMDEELGQPVTHYQLSDRQDSTDSLRAQVQRDGMDVVVTLGRAGYTAARAISGVLPVVIGAVSLPPGQERQGLSGISLTPDAELLFTRLKELAPNTREVTVVYDPERNAEEIGPAQAAAESRGLTLHALPAADLRQAAAIYRQVLLEIKDASTAIWLPRDNATLDEQALLPLVLREAWDKSFVVFSSNLDHVRKGALFSLYPDNAGLGRALAVMARNRAQGQSPPSDAIEPLRDVLMAVNLRTAHHLGLRFSNDAVRAFGMTFPARP
jgi:putative ABC transport system substrate-binding protein